MLEAGIVLFTISFIVSVLGFGFLEGELLILFGIIDLMAMGIGAGMIFQGLEDAKGDTNE